MNHKQTFKGQMQRRFIVTLAVFLAPITAGFASAYESYTGLCGGWMDAQPERCTLIDFALREAGFLYMVVVLPFVVCSAMLGVSVAKYFASSYAESEDGLRLAGIRGGLLGIFAGYILYMFAMQLVTG